MSLICDESEMVALCVIHTFSFLGREIWSYAQLYLVDSERVASVHPPISANKVSSIFQ